MVETEGERSPCKDQKESYFMRSVLCNSSFCWNWRKGCVERMIASKQHSLGNALSGEERISRRCMTSLASQSSSPHLSPPHAIEVYRGRYRGLLGNWSNLLGTASWNEDISFPKISWVLSQNWALFPHLTEWSVPHPLHPCTRWRVGRGVTFGRQGRISDDKWGPPVFSRRGKGALVPSQDRERWLGQWGHAQGPTWKKERPVSPHVAFSETWALMENLREGTVCGGRWTFITSPLLMLPTSCI